MADAPQDNAGKGSPGGGPLWPVQPLGHRRDCYYLISPSGQLRVLRAAELRRTGLLSLFDGAVDALAERFPVYTKDGAPRTDTFSEQAAGAAVIRACAAKGIFNDALPVRGLGVWKSAGGLPLTHCGDVLVEFYQDMLGCRAETDAGCVRPEAIYPAAPAIARPASGYGLSRSTREAGVRLLQDLREEWNFSTPAGADAVAGFVGVALLGAYAPTRPNLYANGRLGVGKTALMNVIAAALGPQAQPVFNNFTEAGLRQAMTGEARALLLDESEAAESGRVARVIELIRSMYSGQGARTVRGSPEGQWQSFTCNGCAYLSSILRAPLKPQDRSRFTLIELAPLPAGASKARAEAVATRAGEASPCLRARALLKHALFDELLERYRNALLADGCDARQADQLATLISGRDMLTRDDLPDAEAIAAELDAWRPLIADAQQDAEDDSEGRRCLDHLLSSAPDLWRSGQRQIVAQVVMAAADPRGTESRRALGTLGLRLEAWRSSGGPPRLLVANSHRGLQSIYRDTPWADGVWAQALRYLPGAEAAGPVRFAGLKQRATAVPEAFLPKPDHDEGEGDNQW